MKVINLKDLSKKDYKRIINRSGGTNQSIMPAVKIVMDNIQKLGDRAILEKYQQRYGKENYQSIQVTREEIKKAYLEVDGQTIKAL